MYDDVWSDEDENPGVSVLRRILEEAKAHHAAAIHIEPQEDDSIRVRLRVDGRLREIAGFPRKLYGALLGRTKVMAGMDVADRLRPQSGVIRFSREWLDTDYLVTTLPAAYGERLCLRARDRSEPLTLEDLGFSKQNLAMYRGLLDSGGGLILHAGLTETGCSGEGSSGRTGLQEILVPNQRLRRLICQPASGKELAHAAQQAGIRSASRRRQRESQGPYHDPERSPPRSAHAPIHPVPTLRRRA